MFALHVDEITVDQAITFWLRRKRKTVQESTHSNYCALLRPLQEKFYAKPLSELTTEDLQEYVNSLLQQKKASAAHHLLDLLVPIFAESVQDGYLPTNPAKFIVLPKFTLTERNVLTVEQQKLFLQAVRKERLCYLFQFQLYTGLRPGEVIALCWEDINFETKTFSIRHSAKRLRPGNGEKSHMEVSATKTGRMRQLKLTKATMQILLWQRELQNEEIARGYYKDTLYVFPNRKGDLLEVNSLNRVLRRVSEQMKRLQAKQSNQDVSKVQMPVFTAHCLRHTFATRALEDGIPQKVVADWLGHSTTRTTGDIYSHVLPEKNIECIQSLELYMNEIASLTLA